MEVRGRDLTSQEQKVNRSKGPKDQDISKSHSNTSLTLKKVHLVKKFKNVFFIKYLLCHFRQKKNVMDVKIKSTSFPP